jgi:hypothetical protein
MVQVWYIKVPFQQTIYAEIIGDEYYLHAFLALRGLGTKTRKAFVEFRSVLRTLYMVR